MKQELIDLYNIMFKWCEEEEGNDLSEYSQGLLQGLRMAINMISEGEDKR